MTNPFFKNTGPYEINDLLKLTSIKNQSISNEKINDIKDLGSSKKGDITFLHSKKYGEHAKSTNASFCAIGDSYGNAERLFDLAVTSPMHCRDG